MIGMQRKIDIALLFLEFPDRDPIAVARPPSRAGFIDTGHSHFGKRVIPFDDSNAAVMELAQCRVIACLRRD